MIRAVVFDFAGVLTSSPFAGLDSYEVTLGYDRGTLRKLMLGDYGSMDAAHPWHRLERGEMTLGDFWTDLVVRAEAEGTPVVLGDLLRSFGSGIEPHAEMLAVARRLRPGYRTAILTNNVREYGDFWRELVDADESFDHVLDSSDLGMRKPEPQIFLHACEVVGIEPTEGVFLDDHPDNIAGAEAVGLHAIHVADHEGAIEALAELLASDGVEGWPDDSENRLSP